LGENRFHELLGLPEEVSDPDHYQLLGVDRTVTDAAAIEARFKEQMTRVQHIENPRHKEFLEFLKGELKRARATLTDEARRREYDQELSEERGEELRKVLSHMLVDGTLSAVAEVSVITEGRNLGLEGAFIRQVVDEELRKAGAKRVTSSGHGPETQVILNKKAQEFARQVQDARLQARVAQTRAQIAELSKKKAEEQVHVVQQQARQAQTRAQEAEISKRKAEQQVQVVREKARAAEIMARKAITQQHVAAAKEQMSEQERRKLEERFAESETRLQNFVDAANEELAASYAKSLRWQRLAECYGILLVALATGVALPAVAPPAGAAVRGAIEPILARVPGGLPPAVIPLLGLVALMLPLHLLAGRKTAVVAAPLFVMIALAVAAGVMRG